MPIHIPYDPSWVRRCIKMCRVIDSAVRVVFIVLRPLLTPRIDQVEVCSMQSPSQRTLVHARSTNVRRLLACRSPVPKREPYRSDCVRELFYRPRLYKSSLNCLIVICRTSQLRSNVVSPCKRTDLRSQSRRERVGARELPPERSF